MSMQTILFTLSARTAFVTDIRGDTLFGQLCWAMRNTQGEAHLEQLLANYSEQPFAVFSDAMPKGYFPKPQVPAQLLGQASFNASERKAFKKQRWLPLSALSLPLEQWQTQARSDQELFGQNWREETVQMHNSISRLTGTTGNEGFAPFQIHQHHYAPGSEMHLVCCFDTQQTSQEELHQLLTYIGRQGFGKEASTGLGKFDVADTIETVDDNNPATHPKANAWLTLAPCVLNTKHTDSPKWRTEHCYYQPFTRFGRHGDVLALSSQVFKNPVLMLDSSALLVPQQWESRACIGQAVGGQKTSAQILSKALPKTVHQGYAPVWPVYSSHLQAEKEQ